MRLLWHLAAAVLGVAVAIASVAVHRSGPAHLGLLLAIVTTFLVAWALRQQQARRLAAAYSLGWLVMFGLVVLGRPEGDFAIASDLDGYALMVAGLILVVVTVAAFAGARGPDLTLRK